MQPWIPSPSAGRVTFYLFVIRRRCTKTFSLDKGGWVE